MKKFPLHRGVLSQRVARTGPVTRAMVGERTRELALKAGHAPPHVTQADYEQAKRELTGESEIDRQDAILDSLPAAKHRDIEAVEVRPHDESVR